MNPTASFNAINKLPPQNIEAEMATLGAMLIDDKVIPEILEVVKEDFFYKQEHQHIFSSIISLFDAHQKTDILTVSEDLNKKKLLEKVGGTAYLTNLADFVPTSANAVHYARIVKEKGILRSLIGSATHIVSLAYKEEQEVSGILDTAEKLIFEISDHRAEGGYVHIKDIIRDGK